MFKGWFNSNDIEIAIIADQLDSSTYDILVVVATDLLREYCGTLMNGVSGRSVDDAFWLK